MSWLHFQRTVLEVNEEIQQGALPAAQLQKVEQAISTAPAMCFRVIGVCAAAMELSLVLSEIEDSQPESESDSKQETAAAATSSSSSTSSHSSQSSNYSILDNKLKQMITESSNHTSPDYMGLTWSCQSSSRTSGVFRIPIAILGGGMPHQGAKEFVRTILKFNSRLSQKRVLIPVSQLRLVPSSIHRHHSVALVLPSSSSSQQAKQYQDFETIPDDNVDASDIDLKKLVPIALDLKANPSSLQSFFDLKPMSSSARKNMFAPSRRYARIIVDPHADTNGWQTMMCVARRISEELGGSSSGCRFLTEVEMQIAFELGNVSAVPLPTQHQYDTSFRRSLTLRELEMHSFMCAIRDKPDWHRKIEDPCLRAQWRQHFLAQGRHQSRISVDAAITELTWWANKVTEVNHISPVAASLSSQLKSASPVVLPSVPETWMCDDLLQPQLMNELKSAIERLERVCPLDYQSDLHEQVINLLDPSLFSLRMNTNTVSYCLPKRIETPDTAIPEACNIDGEAPPDYLEDPEADHECISRQFAWLPTDITVSEDGELVRFDSYVNNLHPTRTESAALYSLLEQALAKFLPIFERTLAEIRGIHPSRCPLPIVRQWTKKPEDASLEEQDVSRLNEWQKYSATEAAAVVVAANKSLNPASQLSVELITLPGIQTEFEDLPPQVYSPPPPIYSAAFVRDISLPDGSTVECDTVITKRWLIRNSGNRRWDADELTLELYSQSGQSSLPTPIPLSHLHYASLSPPEEACCWVPAAEPGQEVEIGFRALITQNPGRYQQRIMLVPSESSVSRREHLYKEGILRLWIDVVGERVGDDTSDIFDTLDYRTKVGEDLSGPETEEAMKMMDPCSAPYKVLPQPVFFPIQERQTSCIVEILKKITPNVSISEAAIGLVTEFQDRVALALLQQHLCLSAERRPLRASHWLEGIPGSEGIWNEMDPYEQLIQQIARGGPDTLLFPNHDDGRLHMRVRWYAQNAFKYDADKYESKMQEAVAKFEENADQSRTPSSRAGLQLTESLADKWLQQFRSLRPNVPSELTVANGLRLLASIEELTTNLLSGAVESMKEYYATDIQVPHIVFAVHFNMFSLADFLRINLDRDPRISLLHTGKHEDVNYEERYRRWMRSRARDPETGFIGLSPEELKKVTPEAAFPYTPPRFLTEKLHPQHPARLADKQLQVNVRIVTIRLTPQSTSSSSSQSVSSSAEYPGEVWHYDGAFNDRIVASGVLMCGSENVTDAHMAFRSRAEDPPIGMDDTLTLPMFGFVDNRTHVQHLGSVWLPNGRALCWPNVIQHRLQPIKLIDSTKPGYQSILMFHLVDPTSTVMSTSYVAPQQREWVVDYRAEVLASLDAHTSLAHDCVGIVSEYLMQNDERIESIESPSSAVRSVSTISLASAQQYRLKMMEDRPRKRAKTKMY